MGVIRSLFDGIDAVKRNPVIVALMFAYALVGAGVNGLSVVDPLLVYPALLVLYLVFPFFLAGFIGVVHEALDGATSLDRFLSAGVDNYLPVLGGGLLLGVVTGILYFVVFFVGFFVVVVAIGATGAMTDPTGGFAIGSLLLLVVLGLLGLLVTLLPVFVLQFFPAAIVVDDIGLIDSFKRSAGLVRARLLSVIGFDVAAFLVGLVAQIPTAYLFAQVLDDPAALEAGTGIFQLLSTSELGIYLAATIVVGTVVGTVTQAFYVAFYDHLTRSGAA